MAKSAERRIVGRTARRFPSDLPSPSRQTYGGRRSRHAAEAVIIKTVKLERITAAFLVNHRELVTATCAGLGAADAGCEGDCTGIAGADRLGVTCCADADVCRVGADRTGVCHYDVLLVGEIDVDIADVVRVIRRPAIDAAEGASDNTDSIRLIVIEQGHASAGLIEAESEIVAVAVIKPVEAQSVGRISQTTIRVVIQAVLEDRRRNGRGRMACCAEDAGGCRKREYDGTNSFPGDFKQIVHDVH